jgi:hypothetical protein
VLASHHLSAAVAEWCGRALEDLGDFEFVAPFAVGLAEDEVNVQTARAEAEIACGRANAVIGTLEGLITEYPRHEPLWTHLITAYYVAERQSERLAPTAASVAASTLDRPTAASGRPAVARLREPAGPVHALTGAATRIGRPSDNDVCGRRTACSWEDVGSGAACGSPIATRSASAITSSSSRSRTDVSRDRPPEPAGAGRSRPESAGVGRSH